LFFQDKVDRAFKWLNDKNKKAEVEENEDIELEKLDILAIIISAVIVFLPILIVLGLIIYFVLRL